MNMNESGKKQCYTKPLHVNLKPSQMGTTIRCKKAIWLTNHLKKMFLSRVQDLKHNFY